MLFKQIVKEKMKGPLSSVPKLRQMFLAIENVVYTGIRIWGEETLSKIV